MRSIPVIIVGVVLTLFLTVFAAEAAAPRPIIGGDLDCSGAVAPRDGQRLMNYVLSQPQISPITTPCPDVGQIVNLNRNCNVPGYGFDCFYTTQRFGDVNCDGLVTAADGQRILNYFLGTPYQCTLGAPNFYTQKIGWLPQGVLGDMWTQW